MRTLRLKVRPWGGALAVLVPDRLAEEEGLRPGDVVEVTLKKDRAA